MRKPTRSGLGVRLGRDAALRRADSPAGWKALRGTIGLALATVTRSAALAIGIGIACVTVLEGVLRAASATVGDWLPGSTIQAVAAGGSDSLSYGRALALATLYLLAGLTASFVVFGRRDITD